MRFNGFCEASVEEHGHLQPRQHRGVRRPSHAGPGRAGLRLDGGHEYGAVAGLGELPGSGRSAREPKLREPGRHRSR